MTLGGFVFFAVMAGSVVMAFVLFSPDLSDILRQQRQRREFDGRMRATVADLASQAKEAARKAKMQEGQNS